MSNDTPAAKTYNNSVEEYNALAGVRQVQGRKIVLAMLLFGCGMIGTLYLYWELYTRPFRPLQAAIAAEFPGSSPRAIGGKPKSHLPGSPSILRLIVRIDWDPRPNDSQARMTANRLTEIAGQHLQLSEYEQMEIVLMHRRPEQWTISWWCEAPVDLFPIPETGPLPESVKTKVTEGVEGS
ncbi:MAG: hypothetical protein ACK5Q5_17515 [Planctomycetaceae bacterium]